MSTSSNSIVQKLYNREVYGTYKYNQNIQNNAKYLIKDIPDHCKFSIANIIEEDVSNHVFMGLTQCGRFLLSYSIHVEQYGEGSESIFTSTYADSLYNLTYKLHIWAFQMNQKAILVSEILLFKDSSMFCYLNIQIAQWPNQFDRVIVFGKSTKPDMRSGLHDVSVTICKLPLLNNCEDCQSIAQVLQNINSRKFNLGNACSVHGFTVHTSYETLIYNPEPSLSLKYDNHIILTSEYNIFFWKIDLDQQPSIDTDRNVFENINAPFSSHELSIVLTELGYKMVIQRDNPEDIVEKKFINTTNCIARKPSSRFSDSKLSFMITSAIVTPLEDNHATENIKELQLRLIIISNNVSIMICELEGLKYWRYNSFFTEIIDVCPLNGDILILMFTDFTFLDDTTKSPIFGGHVAKSVILWNTKTNTCSLEGYCILRDAEYNSYSSSILLELIHDEVKKLRQKNLSFFNIPESRKVRCLQHEVMSIENNTPTENSTEILDEENMIVILRNETVVINRNNSLSFHETN